MNAPPSLETPLSSQAEALLAQCRAHKALIATAESCTGGLVAAALTAIAGSSDVVDRGFVTYSNDAKTEMLGVPAPLIATHGAVSAPVAQAMALGALAHSRANLAVSITGIAGPSGGTAEKPVGTVWFGVAYRTPESGQPPAWHHTESRLFAGDRTAIRVQAAQHALQLLGRAMHEHHAKNP